ncbi:HXXEE domain-containing protein [Streptomyces albidochromogenes]|uniref:HXXEE domain-containing protein n=1 Tax=Streptomyces albidochromogenes TaxID=329524 RepID=A0ABW6FL71_9ACTN
MSEVVMSERGGGRAPGGVGAGVTFGLLVAWAVHDAEEVATVPRWARTQVPELRERFPQVPEPVWRRLESIDGREFAAAVGAMALVVAAAAVQGHRTGGRSAFYQQAVDGFGLHGLVHLAQAAAVGRYTPGSVTSALTVVPFTLWARRRLRRAGVLLPARPGDAARSLAFAAVATAGAHAVARRVVGRSAGTRRA